VSLSAYGHAEGGPWAGRRGFDSLVQSATGLNVAEAEADNAAADDEDHEGNDDEDAPTAAAAPAPATPAAATAAAATKRSSSRSSSVPRALPVQALDYGAGYLLAFGALSALLRQFREGHSNGGGGAEKCSSSCTSSMHVRVALAGVGRWLSSLPRVSRRAQRTVPPLEFEPSSRRLSGGGVDFTAAAVGGGGGGDAAAAAPASVDDGDEDAVIMQTSASGFGELSAVRHAVRFSHSSAAAAYARRPSMPPGSHPPLWPARPERVSSSSL
jgi:hypothetical protein